MGDYREFSNEPEEALRTSIAGLLKESWSAMPCIITEDSDGHTCSAQPTIKRRVDNADGTTTYEDHPVHVDVPVHFHSGGGTTFTHPVKKDDEGILVYASRNIDGWHQSGGTQQPLDDRMNHQADAMYIPGIRSTPRKLDPPPSTTSSQMRSDDGKHIVDLHPQNGLSLKSSMQVTLDAPSHTIKGSLTIQPDDNGNGGNVMINKLGSTGKGSGGSLIAQLSVTSPEGKVGP